MYDQAKLKSLQELRAMLDQESLGRLKKPAAAEAPGELPAAAHEDVPAAAPEQEDPAQLQALLEAYGKEEETADVPSNINGSW